MSPWHRPQARALAGLAALAASLLPRAAWAIPSPEVVVSSASLLGWIVGGVLALLGIGLSVPRGRRKAWTRSLVAPGVVLLLIGGLLAVERLGLEREARRIEHEFRCDFGYHAQRREAGEAWERLLEGGRVGYLPASAFAQTAGRTDVHVVALDLRLPWWFESGHLAAPDAAVVSRQIHLGEFERALRDGLQEAQARGLPAVLLLTSQRPNPLMYWADPERAEIAERMDAFARVEVYLATRHDPADPFYADAVWLAGDTAHLGPGEQVRRARANADVVWPVLDEGMLIDASSVWRSEFGRRLGAAGAADLLDDPEVRVVVPFADFYRDAETYTDEFVRPLLPGVSAERVVVLDYSAHDVRARRAALVETLGDGRWMVVGLTKFDAIHYGFDAIWAATEGGAAAGFAGWTDDLAAAAALRAVRTEARRSALPASVGVPVARWLVERWGADVATGWFFALWGALWGLLGLPFEWIVWRDGVRTRRLAARVERMSAWNRRAARATLAALRPAGPRASWGAAAWLGSLLCSLGAVASATAIGGWLVAESLPGGWVPAVAVAVALAAREGRARHAREGRWRASDGAAAAAFGALLAVLVTRLPDPAAWALAGALVARLPVILGVGRDPWRAEPGAGTLDKAERLRDAHAAWGATGLVRIPELRVVDADAAGEGGALTGTPVGRSGTGRWAVRSSAAVEDGLTRSHAGAFLTVLDVADEAIEEAVGSVRASMRPVGGGRVIVQRQVRTDAAMVVFSEDPGSRFALRLEVSSVGGGALVGGSAADTRVFRLSRLSGRWLPAPPRAELARWDCAAFVALHLSDAMGMPVDLELVVSPGERVPWLVQVRPATGPATRVPAVEALEERRLVAALEGAGEGPVLDALRWEGSEDTISQAEVVSMRALHAPGGPADRASDAAGAARLRGAGEPLVWDGTVGVRSRSPERAWEAWTRVARAALRGRATVASWDLLAERARALDVARTRCRSVLHRPEQERARVLIREVFPAALAAARWTDEAASVGTLRGALPTDAPAWLGAPSLTACWEADRAGASASALWRRWWYREGDVYAFAGRRPGVDEAGSEWEDPWERYLKNGGDADGGSGTSPRVAMDRLRDRAHDLFCLATACMPPVEAGARAWAPAVRSWTLGQLDERIVRDAGGHVGERRGFGGLAVWARSVEEARRGLEAVEPGVEVVLVTDRLAPSYLDLVRPGGAVVGWISARGSLLAHAAIVARELGVPVVVSSRATPGVQGRAVEVGLDGRVEATDPGSAVPVVGAQGASPDPSEGAGCASSAGGGGVWGGSGASSSSSSA